MAPGGPVARGLLRLANRKRSEARKAEDSAMPRAGERRAAAAARFRSTARPTPTESCAARKPSGGTATTGPSSPQLPLPALRPLAHDVAAQTGRVVAARSGSRIASMPRAAFVFPSGPVRIRSRRGSQRRAIGRRRWAARSSGTDVEIAPWDTGRVAPGHVRVKRGHWVHSPERPLAALDTATSG
jgi:hypothetical protein